AMESIDYNMLMQANAARVFSERDPRRRLAAIRELYTADAVLTEPEAVVEGQAAICDAVSELLSKLPPAFAFAAVGPAVGHHDVGRLLWKAGPPNGPPAVTGMDIAHFKDGRIHALYVFLDPEAP
ncbi:MAG TPA: nuclear transport factor 2 family protein, partial [Candidatus Acidoferrum sp.]|nr:nuclear transport factor 2 family protein [Candidatus Acidoferrum sp.]